MRSAAVVPRPGNTQVRGRDLWPGVGLAVLMLLLQGVYWALRIRSGYFPAGDEFSLLVHSTRFFHPNAGEWFRHGFAGYFSPFPDLSLPYSNFLRPMANLTYYLESLLFGRHWSLYLWGNYAIEAALVYTVWSIARIGLRLPPPISVLVAIASAFSPAFSYQAVFRPSFAFDLLGGLWALLALAALLNRRWGATALFVTLAVLTKETAYYVALAASVAAFFLLRQRPLAQRLLRSGAYLLPLLFVVVLRRLDFAGGQGAYVLNEATGVNPVKRLVIALTHWPYMLPGEQHIFERSFHNLAALSMSVVIWCLVLILCLAVLRGDMSAAATGRGAELSRADGERTLLIFLGASLLLPLGLDLAPRFGASTVPLLFLSLGVLAARDRSSRMVRWTAVTVLAVALCANVVALVAALTDAPLHREQALWARSLNMVALLAREEQPVVFLVDDATESFSSPSSVQRFAGYDGTIVPLNDAGIGNCLQAQLTVTPGGDSSYGIHSTAPGSCGGIRLGATFHMTPGPVHTFVRQLPEADVAYDAHAGGWESGQFGTQDLSMQLTPKVPRFAIVYPVSEDSPELLQVIGASTAK